MSEDIVSNGLVDDRYVKALRLVDEFQSQMGALLRQFEERMIAVQPELFQRGESARVRQSENPGSGLANHRINHSLTGPAAPEGVNLNVHLYWMPPAEYNRTDIDGALRAFGYKLKGADGEIDNSVVERTRAGEWEVDMAPNPYDSNTVFYRHVSSKAEIMDAMDVLVDHFEMFGDAYHV
ncbi:hypothetical protein [Halorubellus sp. PRR65]|uniref:hypothetical protein n=1 Tax=Halorubellus sp. PRR65 TaxID=3098148 RepID=UPI002B262E98|nr:hypothetical protein [Halorubellus sp. PRR65]